ncbi:ABC transporter ATP-binding protein [Desulfuromonas sp. DDH964]|uniref:ABC transporter ATP-binding protein n=1 Tax=Desulfuromonas sp. DDH964 TaxID=1823759 RepID=UPI00078D747D|nr:ATP-binding cassette domain-containing protein [Desulfuromonas sp. DDH964]AMV72338.1 ABC transporter ATP-binding protein [Desulfuromonas sp. DDH964]
MSRNPEGKRGVSGKGRLFSRLVHSFSGATFVERPLDSPYEASTGVAVRVEHLFKSFSGMPVLRDINLDIQAGETFSIIGPSGTGKSVLLKHLARLLRPDQGAIRISGVDILSGLPPEGVAGYRYSMVFQSSALFNSLTVGENVGLWLREKQVCSEARVRRIIREKLRLVGLAGKEEVPTSELSGGMKKRVAIARSLAMNPDLILYDEPTAELDPVTSDELARVIQNLKQEVNLTTIIVTHDLNFAMYLSDRIAMISGGEIIEVGTPAEIKASQNPVIRNFIYTTTKGIKGED